MLVIGKVKAVMRTGCATRYQTLDYLKEEVRLHSNCAAIRVNVNATRTPVRDCSGSKVTRALILADYDAFSSIKYMQA